MVILAYLVWIITSFWDKKFAPFREYFKKIQRQRFNKYMKLGKKLTANGFVLWFLKAKATKISIPYRQSNWESKLNQLAQANNRGFKKLLNDKVDSLRPIAD